MFLFSSGVSKQPASRDWNDIIVERVFVFRFSLFLLHGIDEEGKKEKCRIGQPRSWSTHVRIFVSPLFSNTAREEKEKRKRKEKRKEKTPTLGEIRRVHPYILAAGVAFLPSGQFFPPIAFQRGRQFYLLGLRLKRS